MANLVGYVLFDVVDVYDQSVVTDVNDAVIIFDSELDVRKYAKHHDISDYKITRVVEYDEEEHDV